MIWYLLKPVRNNFERILSTTRETVKSSKDRAAIFGRELKIIGDFLDESFSATDNTMKNNFW